MFKSILCPVNFSEHAERALGYALDLAGLTGAHLTIVTVVDALLHAAAAATGSPEAITQQTQREFQAMLQRMAATRPGAAERPGLSVVIGDAGEEILKQIDECRSDLVVMGTQGLGAAQRLVFGSTTQRVLRESRVPVLAVPPPRA